MEYKISNKMKNMKPSAIREIFKSLTNPEIIAFAAGNPAPESFPKEAIAEISAEIFKNNATLALQYGITEGYLPLREDVKKRLHEKFNIGRETDNTVIMSGGQQGLQLACKVMCNEGDAVICENPSFIGALNAFRSLGARPVGVELEDDGVNIEALEEAFKTTPNAKLFYIISTFHNPAGISTSLEKRRAIYDLCVKYGIVILEDNPYGELRFAGEDLPTIKSMDEENIVIYCGSFSKILSAGMRVGFLSAPNGIAGKIVVAKQVEDVHTNQFFQMLCSDFIAEYGLDSHIECVRAIYRRKCTLMLDALDKFMPECVKFTRPDGGLFVWLTLPEEINLQEFVQEALLRKVAVVPGTAFTPDEHETSHSFRITYSTPTDEQIVEGVKILADVVLKMLEK